MVVTVIYEDNTSKQVNNYNYTPTRALTVSDRYITISYTENGVTKQIAQAITVTNKLTGIGITNLAKTNYKQGETINKEDIEVTALYEDNSTKPVTNFTYEPTGALQAENTSITVTYTEDGVTKTTSKDIQVTYASVLEITSEPEVEFKTTYIKGEDFDPTGLMVTVIYEDGNALPITNYEIVNGEDLQEGTTEIIIRYTEGGITLEKGIPITVTNNITSIAVTTLPDKTTYNHNEEFDKTGMVVTVTYQNNETKELEENEYTVSTPTYGQNYVTITHIETGLTTMQAVTVNRVLVSIEITTSPTLTYNYGETFSTNGMVVKARYTDSEIAEEITGYTTSPVNGTTLDHSNTTLTVTYQGKGDTKAITINKVLSKIEITTNPTLTYNYGATFSTGGMVVTATYSDNSTADVTSSCTTSPLDGATLNHSHTTLTATYQGKTATKAMTINKVLSKIEITTNPTLTYNYGETFSTNGMVVTATYSDNSTANVTSNCTTSPVNGATLNNGHTTLTVTYQGKTDTKAMTINKVLSKIEVTTAPTKTIYNVGENFSTSGMVVTATYTDGTTANVTSSCIYSPTTSTELTKSHNSITISYGGKTTSQAITVRTYLYVNGNQCTSITGGWTNYATVSYWTTGYNNVSLSETKATLQTSSIYFPKKSITTSSHTGATVSIATGNKINLSQYSKICARYSITTQGQRNGQYYDGAVLALAVASDLSIEYLLDGEIKSYRTCASTVSSGTLTFNLNSITDSRYILLITQCFGSGYTADSPTAYVYEVWLE